MSRQFYNPAPVLHDILGIDPAFNGTLTFYEIGTTDLKDTWSDYDQTVLNPNPVLLDSAARSATQVWLDGEYTVVLRNEDEEIVWTRDLRPEQAGSDELPAKEDGKFLTTDGENWLMADVRQVPDPTGFSGRILSNDGANLLWSTVASLVSDLIPPVPDPEIIVTDTTFQAGVSDDDQKFYTLRGDFSATASNSNTATVSITFPGGFTFDSPPDVFPVVTMSTAGSSGFLPAISVTGRTTGGATLKLDTNGNGDIGKITNPITGYYMAVGRKTVA